MYYHYIDFNFFRCACSNNYRSTLPRFKLFPLLYYVAMENYRFCEQYKVIAENVQWISVLRLLYLLMEVVSGKTEKMNVNAHTKEVKKLIAVFSGRLRQPNVIDATKRAAPSSPVCANWFN